MADNVPYSACVEKLEAVSSMILIGGQTVPLLIGVKTVKELPKLLSMNPPAILYPLNNYTIID